jgi:hypothetical protein
MMLTSAMTSVMGCEIRLAVTTVSLRVLIVWAHTGDAAATVNVNAAAIHGKEEFGMEIEDR